MICRYKYHFEITSKGHLTSKSELKMTSEMQPKNRLQSGKRELHPYVRPGLCSVWFSKYTEEPKTAIFAGKLNVILKT